MDARLTGAMEQYFSDAFGFTNEDGSRGHERGIRILAECPLCGDSGGRSWYHARKGEVGCLRDTCSAFGGLPALQTVQDRETKRTIGETIAWLMEQYPDATAVVAHLPLPPSAYADWCVLPSGFSRLLAMSVLSYQQESFRFAQRQWGVSPSTLERAGAGYCLNGRYAYRIVLPIHLGGKLVAFQARSFRGGEPKYLTSSWGVQGEKGAECGRPAEAIMYNLDSVTPGCEVTLVEGIGDVLACLERKIGNVPVASMGVEISAEKAAMLLVRQPSVIRVAMHSARGAMVRGSEHVAVLRACGGDARLCTWTSKDAGSGGSLQEIGSGLMARLGVMLHA